MIDEKPVPAPPSREALKDSLSDQLRAFADGRDWAEYALLSIAATRLEYLEARQAGVTRGLARQISADLELRRLLEAARSAISTVDVEDPAAHSSPAVQTFRAAVVDIERKLAAAALAANGTVRGA